MLDSLHVWETSTNQYLEWISVFRLFNYVKRENRLGDKARIGYNQRITVVLWNTSVWYMFEAASNTHINQTMYLWTPTCIYVSSDINVDSLYAICRGPLKHGSIPGTFWVLIILYTIQCQSITNELPHYLLVTLINRLSLKKYLLSGGITRLCDFEREEGQWTLKG